MTWQAHLALLLGVLLLVNGSGGSPSRTAVGSIAVPSAPLDLEQARLATPVPSPGVVPLFAPSAPILDRTAAEPGGPRAVSLDEAELARRNGDFDGAAAILRHLVAEADSATVREALLQLGVVLVEAGRGTEAAESARELLSRSVDQAMWARGALVRGRAQRTAGDCAAALRSFAEAGRVAAEAGLDLGPYLDLQMAECHAKLDDRVGQADRATKALATANLRPARIDALEHQVDASLRRGDHAAALRSSEQLLAETGVRAYRAKTLASIGAIHLDGGNRDAAATAFATIVAELPETAAAGSALERLAELDGLGGVAPDQIGLVHHFQGRHARAVEWLTSALNEGLAGERAARARSYLGHSLLRLERLDDGVAALRRLASEAPGSELAPQALLRAGRALETSDRLGDAEAIYRETIDTFPGSAAAHEAQYHQVVTLLRRGALAEATATGRDLAGSNALSRWKGLGLFWAGKAFAAAGDRAQAEAAWRQAADLDHDDFGGLRARAILEGDARATNGPRTLDPAALRPTEADRAELDAWLLARGADAAGLEAEQATDPGYARARELFRLGLREQARWELQDVAARVAGDPARLVWLARFAGDRGEPQLGIRFAVDARQASGEPFGAQPRLLQRLIMPLPYAELIIAQAQDRGVDPLLFAALVRQESAFLATARSSADAIGLAQVIPPTGQEIARAVGRRDYKTEDLTRPIVSVELGVYYLASQLKAFGGLIYPALAAYNAGGGPVNTWLRELGSNDVDLFAERIPYAETNHYVQVVYENYRLYQRLYGG